MQKIKSIFRVNANNADRVFGLDLMRAVAILLVMLINGDPLVRRNFVHFPRFWHVDGVDLFFVLSGFLIGRILIRTFEKNGNSAPAILHFWKFRWFRTLPNYYLILFATLVFVVIQYGAPKGFDWRYFFFLQNLTTEIPSFFTVSWSLVVEEWFYVLFPLVFCMFSHSIPGLTVRRAVLTTTLFFIAAPLALRFSKVLLNLDSDQLPNISTFFNYEMQFRAVAFFRLDSIAFGVLGAYFSIYHERIWNRYRIHAFVTGVFMYFLVRTAFNTGLFKYTLSFTFSAFALSLLLPFASGIRTAPKVFSVPITHLSIISYSIYLIHRSLVVDAFRVFGGRPFTDSQAIIYYISYFPLTILLSTILYRYFEAPVMRLRERAYFFGAKKEHTTKASRLQQRSSIPTARETVEQQVSSRE